MAYKKKNNSVGVIIFIIIFFFFFVSPIISSFSSIGAFGGIFILLSALVPIIVIVIVFFVVIKAFVSAANKQSNMNPNKSEVNIPFDFFNMGPPVKGTQGDGSWTDKDTGDKDYSFKSDNSNSNVLYYENGKPVYKKREY